MKETSREQRTTDNGQPTMTDLKYAFRQFLKHKGSSFLAVIILALGIGGTTAVYSVADKVLLNPIPGRNTDRLVSLREVNPRRARDWRISAPVIEEVSRHRELIDSLTYYSPFLREKKSASGDKTVKLRGAIVAPNFFDILELRPLIGRTFVSADGDHGVLKTIVINYGLWMRRFGGNPGVIGKILELDGVDYSIIGVMPSNVQFPFAGEDYMQFWLPHTFTTDELNTVRADWAAMARIREGVELPKVQAMLDVVAARRPHALAEGKQPTTLQARPARWNLTSPVLQKTIWTLLAMLGTLLQIACANVGNLLLSRLLARRGEIAVRIAVGAGRLRIGRQHLVESLVLAGLAAALGIFIAWAGIIALEQFYLTNLPRVQVVGLDWTVLGITCGVSVAAGLLFGTVPAALAARTNVNHLLNESEGRHSGGLFQKAIHNSLVVIQVCLAVVMLTGAFSMIANVIKLLRADMGLEARGLYRVYYDAIDFMFKNGWPKPEQLDAFRRVALERLRAIPGVDSVGHVYEAYPADYEIEGRAERINLLSRIADSGDFLRTIGAELVIGRLPNREDAQPGEPGVVINEAMASIGWPGGSPLGKQFKDGASGNEYRVIGVIKNVSERRSDSEARPEFFQAKAPRSDAPPNPNVVSMYYVRSSLEPQVLRAAMMEPGEELLAPVELIEFTSIESRLHQSMAPRRVMMWLLISLGGLGLLLSAMGLYAVLSFAVNRRTREVGIRMAVGASRNQVWALFFRRGARLALNGVILGTVLAVGLAQYVNALLYGVPLATPRVLVLVALTILASASVACSLPARRAAMVDPMTALRTE